MAQSSGGLPVGSSYEQAISVLTNHSQAAGGLPKVAAVQADGVLWHMAGAQSSVALFPDSLGVVSALVARGVRLALLCEAGQETRMLERAQLLLGIRKGSEQAVAVPVPVEALAPVLLTSTTTTTTTTTTTIAHPQPQPFGDDSTTAVDQQHRQALQKQTLQAGRDVARALRQVTGVPASGTLMFLPTRSPLLPPVAHDQIQAQARALEQQQQQQRHDLQGEQAAAADVDSLAGSDEAASPSPSPEVTAGVAWSGAGGASACAVVACHHALGLGVAHLRAALSVLQERAQDDRGI